MRGTDEQQSGMFSYISVERRVPQEHPLRAIRAMADAALKELGPRFDALYAHGGRPSIAPEKLLRALLVQVLYTVRSERLLMEQLDYNFLFRWFVGLNLDDPVWDATVFTKNRERLLAGEVAQGFFDAVVEQARAQGLLSDEHFTVDGTLIEAWAGHKSFQRKGGEPQPPPADPGNPGVDFHGERRTNATHQSTTDPEARLARKGAGKEAHLCYAGHLQMDNRHGLAVNTRLTQPSGTAEPEAALAMVEEIPGWHRVTLGADKGYDRKEFVQQLREHRVTPHIAHKQHSAIDGRTTGHPGYRLSQRARKRVEEIFGWLKTVANLRKTRHRGVARVGWMFTFAAAAYNLVRMRNLALAPP
ncbi:MAG: IS5 family transposase [Terriglobales bacterium]